jgi:DNA-binding response OmpR family regulator
MRILLIEDEMHVRVALARPLAAWGHEVTEASSVESAKTALAKRAPDLAVVDINLPDGTGWDVLEWIHQQARADTRTIVMSAVPPSSERLRQFRPDGVLLKPFPIESLRQLVSRVGSDPQAVEDSINA